MITSTPRRVSNRTRPRQRHVTWTSIQKRLRSAGLVSRLSDPRNYEKKHTFTSLIHALTLGMLAGHTSLRAVEQMTHDMHPVVRRAAAIAQPINDTDLGRAVAWLTHDPVRDALHAMVKAEIRRKSLEPVGLPHHWVALDGKGIGKLVGDDNLAHPAIQPVDSDSSGHYGLARVHRVVLVSTRACVGIDQRPIEGNTNEIGALPRLLSELFQAYGRTELLGGIIADAGNCSQAVARQIHDQQRAYALRIKSCHGEIWLESQRQLADRGRRQAEATFREMVSGPGGKRVKVEYRVYRHNLGACGWLAWSHARQLIRIERLTYDVDGNLDQHGNRYWVSNEPFARMNAAQWLELSRRYWRIENESNWTHDVLFNEDSRRTPWTTSAEPLYAVAALRLIALTILALMRTMIRAAGGGQLGWKLLVGQVGNLVCAAELPRELPALS